MDSTNNNSGKSMTGVVGIVLLVVGLAIGFGVTKAMDKNNNKTTSNDQTPTTSTKAADLRSTLVTLGVNHMNYTDQAVDAALDSAPNATQMGGLLNQNGKDLGAAVGSVYGTDAQTTFDKVWQLHLDDFVKYAVADSKGDNTSAQAALTDIDTNYTKPLAQFLAKANPNLPESALESGLRDHVDMTAQMIDDHVKAKYADESKELDMANTHIASLMSTLAGGIVKQYPSKFNN